MSLRDLEQKNILTNWQNKEELSFPKKISLALTAFVLSTNLALAEPNKKIWIVSFTDWSSAELCLDKKWTYYIQNGNSKNWTEYIYWIAILNGKKYIVHSLWIDYDIDVFLEADLDLYKEYIFKYGQEKAYKLIKAREQYLEIFAKDNPTSNFSNESERIQKSLEWWEFLLSKLTKK